MECGRHSLPVSVIYQNNNIISIYFFNSHLLVSGQVTTTTTAAPSGYCPNIPSVANAYVSAATYVQYGNNRYPSQVEFTCAIGYYRARASGQSVVSCTNGIWDPLPFCAGILSMQTSTLNTQY
jgi:hypothetical protein